MVDVWRPPGSGQPGDPTGAPGGEQGRILDDHEYGRGAYDPVTGLWEWYELPEERATSGQRVSWAEILTNWRLVEADLHDVYGIDVEDRELMRSRSWRWLEVRITGLLAADTRLYRALAPEPELPDVPPGIPGLRR